MSILTRAALATALLVASVGSANASESVRAGEYEDVDGAVGSLSVAPADNNELSFRLFAEGANGHSCSLSGTIKGGQVRGVGGRPGDVSVCVVDFHAMPRAIRVEVENAPGNFEACRTFCGMRASFDRTYFLPPVGCTRSERQNTYHEFTQANTAKDFQRAYEVLEAVQSRCGRFLGWVEQDRVHNHLALALHGVGHDEECLSELANTMAASAGDEAALHEKFVGIPMSFEAYLPTARTTWKIRSLCSTEGTTAP